MTDTRHQISNLMHQIRRRGRLPTSEEIVKETFQRLGYIDTVISPEEVQENFNDLLRTLWKETLVTLEQHEEQAYGRNIARELIDQYPEGFSAAEQIAKERGFRSGVIELFQNWYPLLREVFLSVSQSRKQRGGKDFELQIEGLLKLAQIPFHKQERQFHTDLILPNLETHRRNRNVSIVVSVKRTLRERWAEVAEELFNLRSPNVFLFTADENVTTTHVERICHRYNIYLVVWEAVKTQKFGNEALVLSYAEWANDRLAILKQYWQ